MVSQRQKKQRQSSSSSSSRSSDDDQSAPAGDASADNVDSQGYSGTEPEGGGMRRRKPATASTVRESSTEAGNTLSDMRAAQKSTGPATAEKKIIPSQLCNMLKLPDFVTDPDNFVGWVVTSSRAFAADSVRLVRRCSKPDPKEFKKIAQACALGFLLMGFIGYIVKLVFIPINNIIFGG